MLLELSGNVGSLHVLRTTHILIHQKISRLTNLARAKDILALGLHLWLVNHRILNNWSFVHFESFLELLVLAVPVIILDDHVLGCLHGHTFLLVFEDTHSRRSHHLSPFKATNLKYFGRTAPGWPRAGGATGTDLRLDEIIVDLGHLGVSVRYLVVAVEVVTYASNLLVVTI